MERLESLLTGDAAEAVANFSSLAEEAYSTTQYSNPAASLFTDTITPHTDTALIVESQVVGEEEQKVDDLDVDGTAHSEPPPLPPAAASSLSAADIDTATSPSCLSLPPWPVFVTNSTSGATR